MSTAAPSPGGGCGSRGLSREGPAPPARQAPNFTLAWRANFRGALKPVGLSHPQASSCLITSSTTSERRPYSLLTNVVGCC